MGTLATMPNISMKDLNGEMPGRHRNVADDIYEGLFPLCVILGHKSLFLCHNFIFLRRQSCHESSQYGLIPEKAVHDVSIPKPPWNLKPCWQMSLCKKREASLHSGCTDYVLNSCSEQTWEGERERECRACVKALLCSLPCWSLLDTLVTVNTIQHSLLQPLARSWQLLLRWSQACSLWSLLLTHLFQVGGPQILKYSH